MEPMIGDRRPDALGDLCFLPDETLCAILDLLSPADLARLSCVSRWYRCFTTLTAFSFDLGDIERKKTITLEEFQSEYDGKKPVLLTELANTWPARTKWMVDQLSLNYGDVAFRISQRTSKKITMKFRDYVSYMEVQHDEDPLYIFDEKVSPYFSVL
ncbi:hypothetical protein BHE74_00029691 [Ensete ventricosum]|nr:hypothetical protein BHE74_00029691 [Ensete ventricosum]RZS19925.1 hypothetical protein BHM03_00052380 [Ensete ventricosum]